MNTSLERTPTRRLHQPRQDFDRCEIHPGIAGAAGDAVARRDGSGLVQKNADLGAGPFCDLQENIDPGEHAAECFLGRDAGNDEGEARPGAGFGNHFVAVEHDLLQRRHGKVALQRLQRAQDGFRQRPLELLPKSHPVPFGRAPCRAASDGYKRFTSSSKALDRIGQTARGNAARVLQIAIYG
jgi:hypothetical protein